MDEDNEFYWPNIFFKVEDKIFCVPRYEFQKSSEVFADMFLLPSGPSATHEGQDKDHPVVLHGYMKDEFACLLKVMYPTASSLISGPDKLDFGLGKEQWVKVLKLATIWNMNKIREYAIQRLSTEFVLSPFEKIQLARVHKVARWFEEGVTSIVNDDRKLTLEEVVTLGWKTAALILWTRDQWSVSAYNSGALHFKKDAIKCGSCSSSASLIDVRHTKDNNCYQCKRPDTELNCPGTFSPGDAHTLVRLGTILCGKCNGDPFNMTDYVCASCSYNHGLGDNVKITAKKPPNEIVKEVFGEEIKELAISVA
ncbi:hypothetical protein GALMADRAFT_253785 [Galerina marginata CBS 339.88]|uniref:BTB domain-containing protein n=1 Tax=Galerina marginata (strain CBS 339.88) TaxID=685588 RepID=A0A067SUZ1_GALM3|nr:hypothetical protein GALMADRAFT_253785 [Galerina marginata CBS 339.88]